MDLSKLSDEELDVLAEKARQALEAQDTTDDAVRVTDVDDLVFEPIGSGDDVEYVNVSFYPEDEKYEIINDGPIYADPSTIQSLVADFVLTYYVTVNAMGGEQELINIATTDGVLVGVLDDPDTVAILAALYFDGGE